MAVELTKDSIDLGIVTRNPEPMLAFYRDTLGFKHEGEMPMPGGGSMQRLMCGTSLIKIVTPGNLSDRDAIPGGIPGATGYRYWTISVSNLDALTGSCKEAGANVAVAPTEIRPGIRIAIVEDPDGNWVEFLEMA
jgi:catechol 2,3-dioxygenase-like lactoylglutathione lyase family enzyme